MINFAPCFHVSVFPENETIGAARGRRRDNGRQTTDAIGGEVEELDVGGVRRARNESRLSLQSSGGSANRTTAATASPTGTISRGRRQGKSKKVTSLAGSGGEKGAASAASAPVGHSTRKRSDLERASKNARGIFGVPVGWNAEDCDYDDSEDETYAPPLPVNPCSAGGAGARPTRCGS